KPQNASPVPLAAPPPGPSPAPLSSGSKTGQITRYKNRSDHESATRRQPEAGPTPGNPVTIGRESAGSAGVLPGRCPWEETMKFLSDEQLSGLLPAETSSFPSPVPTQIVSSDEYLPVRQTAQQHAVEARLKELSGPLAK